MSRTQTTLAEEESDSNRGLLRAKQLIAGYQVARAWTPGLREVRMGASWLWLNLLPGAFARER